MLPVKQQAQTIQLLPPATLKKNDSSLISDPCYRSIEWCTPPFLISTNVGRQKNFTAPVCLHLDDTDDLNSIHALGGLEHGTFDHFSERSSSTRHKSLPIPNNIQFNGNHLMSHTRSESLQNISTGWPSKIVKKHRKISTPLSSVNNNEFQDNVNYFCDACIDVWDNALKYCIAMADNIVEGQESFSLYNSKLFEDNEMSLHSKKDSSPHIFMNKVNDSTIVHSGTTFETNVLDSTIAHDSFPQQISELSKTPGLDLTLCTNESSSNFLNLQSQEQTDVWLWPNRLVLKSFSPKVPFYFLSSVSQTPSLTSSIDSVPCMRHNSRLVAKTQINTSSFQSNNTTNEAIQPITEHVLDHWTTQINKDQSILLIDENQAETMFYETNIRTGDTQDDCTLPRRDHLSYQNGMPLIIGVPTNSTKSISDDYNPSFGQANKKQFNKTLVPFNTSILDLPNSYYRTTQQNCSKQTTARYNQDQSILATEYNSQQYIPMNCLLPCIRDGGCDIHARHCWKRHNLYPLESTTHTEDQSFTDLLNTKNTSCTGYSLSIDDKLPTFGLRHCEPSDFYITQSCCSIANCDTNTMLDNGYCKPVSLRLINAHHSLHNVHDGRFFYKHTTTQHSHTPNSIYNSLIVSNDESKSSIVDDKLFFFAESLFYKRFISVRIASALFMTAGLSFLCFGSYIYWNYSTGQSWKDVFLSPFMFSSTVEMLLMYGFFLWGCLFMVIGTLLFIWSQRLTYPSTCDIHPYNIPKHCPKMTMSDINDTVHIKHRESITPIPVEPLLNNQLYHHFKNNRSESYVLDNDIQEDQSTLHFPLKPTMPHYNTCTTDRHESINNHYNTISQVERTNNNYYIVDMEQQDTLNNTQTYSDQCVDPNTVQMGYPIHQKNHLCSVVSPDSNVKWFTYTKKRLLYKLTHKHHRLSWRKYCPKKNNVSFHQSHYACSFDLKPQTSTQATSYKSIKRKQSSNTYSIPIVTVIV